MKVIRKDILIEYD